MVPPKWARDLSDRLTSACPFNVSARIVFLCLDGVRACWLELSLRGALKGALRSLVGNWNRLVRIVPRRERKPTRTLLIIKIWNREWIRFSRAILPCFQRSWQPESPETATVSSRMSFRLTKKAIWPKIRRLRRFPVPSHLQTIMAAGGSVSRSGQQ